MNAYPVYVNIRARDVFTDVAVTTTDVGPGRTPDPVRLIRHRHLTSWGVSGFHRNICEVGRGLDSEPRGAVRE